MSSFANDSLPTDIPTVTCSLSDGRVVTAVQEAETTSIWAEITGDSLYRDAAAGVGPGEIIIDIGAHIGLASLWFAEQAPDATVVAFEPAPKTFFCLEANLAKYVPRATAVRMAVGARQGTAELTFRPYVASASTLHLDAADDDNNLDVFLRNTDAEVDAETEAFAALAFNTVQTVPVEVTTLSQALQEISGIVGLLKIDVERGELDVLKGASADDWERIRRILMEVHDVDGKLGTVVGLLASSGYEVAVTQFAAYSGGSVFSVLATREPG